MPSQEKETFLSMRLSTTSDGTLSSREIEVKKGRPHKANHSLAVFLKQVRTFATRHDRSIFQDDMSSQS